LKQIKLMINIFDDYTEVILSICSKFKCTSMFCLYDITVFTEVNAYRRRNSLEGICLSSVFRTNYAELSRQYV